VTGRATPVGGQSQLPQDGEAVEAVREFDARALRQVMGDFATGVVVVACEGATGPMAMTVNAFTSVSLDPPLVLVSLAHKARLMALLALGVPFSISILGDRQRDIASHFGGKPDPDFIPPLVQASGLPVVAGAAAHIGCEVADMVRQGDHTLVIGRVAWIGRRGECGVLTFHRGGFGALA